MSPSAGSKAITSSERGDGGPTPGGSNPPLLLGIDAGGSQTRALIADSSGKRSMGLAGPANWTTLGPVRCVEAISAAMGQALELQGRSVETLSGACVSLAGYYPLWHEQEVTEALAGVLPGVPVRLEPDLVAAWAGATGGRPGVVLVVGTGSVAYGRDSSGRCARAGGWGPLFGDEGSGYWIGCEALRAVARAFDGRGPETVLQEVIVAPQTDESADAAPRSASTAPSVEQSLRAVYRDEWTRERVASLARWVVQVAEEGDGVARQILERATDEWLALVVAVARRLGWTFEPFDLAGVGGVFEARAIPSGTLERRLGELLPNARWRAPLASPVEGALVLAKEVRRCPTS